MALSRLNMANEVLDNLGRSSAGQTRSGTTLSAMVIRWLDRAQVRITRRAELLFKIATASTTASQLTYAFPSNVKTVFSIRLEDGTNSRKLIPVMPWEFDYLVPRPASNTTGRPDFYVPYKASNTFELFRIPDATYTMRLRYSIWPTALTTDSQTTDFQAAGIDTDDVMIYFATEEGFNWLQEFVDAKVWMNRANDRLKEIIESEEHWPDWEPVSRGFDSTHSRILGEYHKDPFIFHDPSY